MKKIVLKLAKSFLKLIITIASFPHIKIGLKEAENEIEKIYKEEKNITQNDIKNLETDEDIDLSIIIPVYNSEKLLAKCINSIINQKTQYKFEIIAINDGSTDSSLEILKGYDQVKTIDKKNEGVAIARNTGLDHAKGRYVAFIDSDDEINELYIEKLLNRAFEKNADIVKCNYVEYSIETKKVMKYERHKDISISGKLEEHITEFKGFVWGGVFKRDLWLDIRFLPQFWYEDMIIRFILFRKCNQFEYINEDLYIYNNHSSNISKSISRTEEIRCLDQLFLIRNLLQISEKLGLEEDNAIYKVLLQELGPILWLRTRDLNNAYKKDAFIIACDIINKYRTKCSLSSGEKNLERAFKRKDFYLWKLCSIYIMLGVKIGSK